MTAYLISRRQFTALIGSTSVAWPLAAHAQPGKLHRIGFLGMTTAALEATLVKAFVDGLQAHGYEEGRNLRIEYRWAEDDYARFPRLVAEMLALCWWTRS